ncbi:MAG: hypothetical protein FWG87_06035 [Defluviitaleaceae bacterium]|nr:hypothetical protein [Defluviitaleaceae bacterium]
MGLVAVFCRGRIYPYRDCRALRYWTLSVLELTSVCRLRFRLGGGFVGDGFIRPEVTSLCVKGRYPSRIDERVYLGAGKPAPYIRQ